VGGDPWAGTKIVNPDAPAVAFDADTFKASLQMQFTDDIMGYISYSEGFNSGGLDSVTLNNQGGGGSRQLWFNYDPETIENREIGMRADLADGKLRVNATYFNSDWLDIQNDGVVRDPDSGVELPTLATTNVGTANASGLELELTVLPTDSLMLNFNLGLLDTGYTYLAPGTDVLTLDTEFQQAPDTTYSIGVQYIADLSNGGSLTTRVDYAYSSQFWRSLPFLRLDWYGAKNGGPVPAGYDEAGEYGLVNARVSFQPASGDYTLSLFGTNLTNEYVLDSGFFHGIWGYDFATVGRPREAGVSFSFNF
jgi:iron complex outermembrane receptor protein